MNFKKKLTILADGVTPNPPISPEHKSLTISKIKIQ